MTSTNAEEWYQKGMAVVRLARTADHQSELEAELREALQHFEQALALEPMHLGALREKGNTLAALGDHARAAETLVAAAQRAPEDADLRRACGMSLQALERREAALEHFQATLSLRPDDPEARFQSARLLGELGRDREALAAWGAVLELPDNRTIVLSGGQPARVTTGDFRRNEALFACVYLRSKMKDPGAFDAWVQLFNARGTALTGMLAPRALLEALKTDPTCRDAYFKYLEGAEGVSVWKRAYGLFIGMGWIEEALKATQRLVELAPDAPETWADRAEALAGAGRRVEAIEAFERSLAIDPRYLRAKARLKVLRGEV